MRIELDIKNLDNIGELSPLQKVKIQTILEALVVCGGLTGVKGGQTIIHFDQHGDFQRIQLSYTPWVKRS